MENKVTTKQQAQTPSTILFRDDAAKGFENVRQESLALPILKLLQNGSGEAQNVIKITLKVLNLVCS
jgi:hypothetical protein